jgi:hypothetical protein
LRRFVSQPSSSTGDFHVANQAEPECLNNGGNPAILMLPLARQDLWLSDPVSQREWQFRFTVINSEAPHAPRYAGPHIRLPEFLAAMAIVDQ